MSKVADPPRTFTRPQVGDEQKADFSFQINADASSRPERKIAGYGSVFNVPIPSYQEVVDPGAFARTISERGDRVKILWQHDSDRPIGLPTELREDGVGLYIEAQLADTASVNEEYMPLLLPGTGGRAVVDRMSIGFRIVSMVDANDSPDGMYHLTDVELYEVSLVTFPANESAIISDVRSVLKLAKRALGMDDDRKPLSVDDAKYAMAILMGARGAGSFSDLAPTDRRGLYERLCDEYTRHSLTPPELKDSGVPAYNKVQFVHDETSVYAARSLRKRLSDVTSAAQHAARLGVPIDSVFLAEAQAALDAINQAVGLDGVSGHLKTIAGVRDSARRLGITLA